MPHAGRSSTSVRTFGTPRDLARSRRTGATDPRQTPPPRPDRVLEPIARRRTARRARAERISSPSRLSPTYSDRGDPCPQRIPTHLSWRLELARSPRSRRPATRSARPAPRRRRERARRSLPLGVPSTFQAYDPHPVVANGPRRPGSRTSTATTTSTSTWASAPCSPATATRRSRAAIEEQLDDGTLFVTPCEPNADVAELLAERYGLPMWRFTNSGTEATMDAIRVARGVTGRDKIVKVEGGYHGHHDEVMISMKPPLDRGRSGRRADGRPRHRGHHASGARRHHRHPLQRPRRARAGAARAATSPASSSSR